jgi:hypothetical protein
VNGHNIVLRDNISDAKYERSGDDIQAWGLYVDLAPWGYHFLQTFLTIAAEQ